MYKKERSCSRENTLPQRKRTPSFSSSLLDAIYRSIDESNGGGGEEEVLSQFQETSMIKKQSTHSVSTILRVEEEKDLSTLGRAILIQGWMEKQSQYSNSTSTSSDSSSGVGGGIFTSSSETESGVENSRRKTSSLIQQRNKQVPDNKQQKPKCEGGFSKTKLKAMKIYGELKKVKQPISPGGRIASFLNSIFSSGSGKRVKMCSIGATDDVTTTITTDRKPKSACSSVTSLSRSCLSKTPPSRGKPGNSNSKIKRSVRFYPVSVIVDEDSRPCGHKCINYEDDPGLMPTPLPQKIVKTSSFKEDASKGAKYVRKYQKKNISEFDFRGFHSYIQDNDVDDEDDDDDDQSCSSSDLFELDHLMGIGRYREELPVYETTNLKKNQAIANGFNL